MPAFAPPPLDESLYEVKTNDAELAFIKEQSGIYDPDELKRHIVGVQTKAYNLFQYRCVHVFAFTRPRIAKLPGYQQALSLGRERDGAVLLDLGCCFGTDIRKAASDGFPIQNLIASDLRPDLWNLGHQLFRSTPLTCPIAFVAGDAFDPDFLEPSSPAASPPETPTPPLASLTRLTPLRGHVAALHIASVFHLFTEPQQLQLARALASLLSPVPGSIIFGSHVGRLTKGVNQNPFPREENRRMFCHSPESWVSMWGEVFPAGAVQVDAQLEPFALDTNVRQLVWSVTRV